MKATVAMRNFIESLVDGYDLNTNVLYDDDVFSEWECAYWKAIRDEWHCSIHYGATKAVFDVDGFNCVIKVPFNKYETDYCDRENENYFFACDAGLEKYFAEIHYMDTLEDAYGYPISFYMQERCDADESAVIDSIMSTTGDDSASGASEDVKEWMELMLGWEEFERLVNFFKLHHINDIHSANLALAHNDVGFVIFDFSGYFGDSCNSEESEAYSDDVAWED